MSPRFQNINRPLSGPTTGEAIGTGLGILAGVMVLVIVGMVLASMAPALAHDFFLNGTKNPAGEWCCGAGDCGLVSKGSLRAVAGGYEVRGSIMYGEGATGNPADGQTHIEPLNEFWRYEDVMPSPDGQTWRCHRPDGSPRCRFTGPPGS